MSYGRSSIRRTGMARDVWESHQTQRISSLRQSRSGGLRTLVNKSDSLMNFLSLQQTALVVPSLEQKKTKKKGGKKGKKKPFF